MIWYRSAHWVLCGGFASSDVDGRTSRNKYDDVVGARRLKCGGARAGGKFTPRSSGEADRHCLRKLGKLELQWRLLNGGIAD